MYFKIDDNTGEIFFVPNYDKLSCSKFGEKYCKGGTRREKNQNYVRLVQKLIPIND